MDILYKEEIIKALHEDNIEQLEVYLRAAIKRKIDEGFVLTRGATYIERGNSKCCCALGSLILNTEKEEIWFNTSKPINALRKLSDNYDNNLHRIILGFDDAVGFKDKDNKYFALGEKLRKDYIAGE